MFIYRSTLSNISISIYLLQLVLQPFNRFFLLAHFRLLHLQGLLLGQHLALVAAQRYNVSVNTMMGEGNGDDNNDCDIISMCGKSRDDADTCGDSDNRGDCSDDSDGFGSDGGDDNV